MSVRFGGVCGSGWWRVPNKKANFFPSFFYFSVCKSRQVQERLRNSSTVLALHKVWKPLVALEAVNMLSGRWALKKKGRDKCILSHGHPHPTV